MDKLIAIFILSSLISILSLYFLIPFSQSKGIGIDLPGKRKHHKTPVPRLGGIGIFLGLLVGVAFLRFNDRIVSYLIASSIIFSVGVIDDIKGVSWWAKMAAVFLATSVTIFYGKITVTSLGDILWFGSLDLGIWSIPFTYFSVLGIVSAINLFDGLNGLAGGTALIIFGFLALFSYMGHNVNFMFISIAIAGGLIGFLRYNYPNSRIFLGDSGSNFLGFSIAIASIVLFQQGRYQPMTPVLLLGLPIFDTIRVMTRRIISRKNPFSADKSHFHHILVRLGMCDKKAVLLIWALSFIFCISAFVLKKEDGWELLLFLLSSIGIISVFLLMLMDIKKSMRQKNILAKRRIAD